MTGLAQRFVAAAAVVAAVAFAVTVAARQTTTPADANPLATAALQRGEAALATAEYEAALDSFTRAHQLFNKSSAVALFGMARAFQALDAWRSAADACTEALKYAGTNRKLEAQLHNQRGLALRGLSKAPSDKAMKDAEAEFRTALAQTEMVPEAWFNLGMALLTQNRDPEGVAALQAFVDSGLASTDIETAKRMIENPRRAREMTAPDFEITSMDGERITLRDLRGKVVLMDFWATWCGPCVRATPMLASLAKARAKDPRFVVLSITDEAAGEASKIRSFGTVNKIAWPMIHDPSHRLNAMYQVRGIPTYIVIDADGVIRERLTGYGPSTRGRLDQAITNGLRAMK